MSFGLSKSGSLYSDLILSKTAFGTSLNAGVTSPVSPTISKFGVNNMSFPELLVTVYCKYQNALSFPSMLTNIRSRFPYLISSCHDTGTSDGLGAAITPRAGTITALTPTAIATAAKEHAIA